MRLTRESIRRGVAATVFLSVIALLAIVLLSSRRTLVEAWRGFSPVAFIIGGIAIALVWSAKAGRMYVIARAMGRRIPFVRFFQIYMTTCFVSHITPFSAGGVPMQVYLIHREGIPLGESTALTAVDIGLNLLVLAVVVPIAFSLKREGLSYKVPAWLGWVVAVLAVLVVAGFLWRRFFGRSSRPKAGWLENWRREYRLFRLGLTNLTRSGKSGLAVSILLTFAYWLFYLLVAPIILLGLGVKVPWGYVLGAQLVFNFLQVLLPTPGGSGGSELLLLGIFAPILERQGERGIFILLWKFYTFYATLMMGGFFFWRLLSARGTNLGRGLDLEADSEEQLEE